MSVMHTLHKHILACQEPHIRMVIPEGIPVTAPVFLVLKFSQRGFISVFLKKIDHSTADDAVDKLKHLRRFLFSIRDEMKMVRHNDVGQNQESTGRSRFV